MILWIAWKDGISEYAHFADWIYATRSSRVSLLELIPQQPIFLPANSLAWIITNCNVIGKLKNIAIHCNTLQCMTSISWVSYYLWCNARIDIVLIGTLHFIDVLQHIAKYDANLMVLILSTTQRSDWHVFNRDVMFIRSHLTTTIILLHFIINLIIQFNSFNTIVLVLLPYSSLELASLSASETFTEAKSQCGLTTTRSGSQAISKSDCWVTNRRE